MSKTTRHVHPTPSEMPRPSMTIANPDRPNRKRVDRVLMGDFTCPLCDKFYDYFCCDRVHNEPEAPPPIDVVPTMIAEESKHRYVSPPPTTPSGFWDLGFPNEDIDDELLAIHSWCTYLDNL